MVLSGHIGLPHHGAPRVGEPPNAHKVARCPQRRVPVAEHDCVTVDGLVPLETVCGDRLKLDLDNNAQRAKGNERSAEKLIILCAASCAHTAVGGDNLELYDRLGDQTMLEGAAVRASGNDASGGLLVNAAQIGHRQAEPVEFFTKLPQANARLKVHNVGGAVDVENLAQIVQIYEP